MSNSARTDTPGGGPLSTVARAIAAAPDAVTCASFLLLWIAPTALGLDAVRGALLLMVVEFLLIHATAMLGGTLPPSPPPMPSDPGTACPTTLPCARSTSAIGKPAPSPRSRPRPPITCR